MEWTFSIEDRFMCCDLVYILEKILMKEKVYVEWTFSIEERFLYRDLIYIQGKILMKEWFMWYDLSVSIEERFLYRDLIYILEKILKKERFLWINYSLELKKGLYSGKDFEEKKVYMHWPNPLILKKGIYTITWPILRAKIL